MASKVRGLLRPAVLTVLTFHLLQPCTPISALAHAGLPLSTNSAGAARSHARMALGTPGRRDALSTLALAAAFGFGPLRLESAAASSAVLRELDKSIEEIFTRNTRSVVFISATLGGYNSMVDMPQGTGSGFVWDSHGSIITNYHLVRNAQDARVTLTEADGRRQIYDARLVGANPDKDIAVLRLLPLDSERIPLPFEQDVKTVPVTLGSSAKLHVGQLAFAIGNPYGLDHTLTMGIVSGLGREMISPSGRPISNVIQTDAAINPGNSGGVLLDLDGRLIGMNTAIYSPSGGNAGIGFAIPVDVLAAQVRSILEKGQATRAVLGVSVLDGVQLTALGIDRGVLVLDVPAGSEAELAGLRGSSRDGERDVVLGDVIVECDGRPVATASDLFRALDTHAPGDVVALSVLRGLSVARLASASPSAPRPGPAAALPAARPESAAARKTLSVKLSGVDVTVRGRETL